MFNPLSIDVKQLPKILLKNKKDLPKIRAVYLAIDSSSNIQYIGRTRNLQARWESHHRENQLKKISDTSIAYLQVDNEILAREIEQALVEWFQPKLNGTEMSLTTDKVRVSTYIEQSLKKKAEKAAKAQGRSLSNYIEQLIKKDVEKGYLFEFYFIRRSRIDIG